MAQKVQVLLVDDIDGGEASETVSFALDGNSYEIDLSGKNATKLRDAFAKYVGAARKVGRSAARPPGGPAGAAAAAAPPRTATRPRRSAPGRRSRATRSATAAGSPPTIIERVQRKSALSRPRPPVRRAPGVRRGPSASAGDCSHRRSAMSGRIPGSSDGPELR